MRWTKTLSLLALLSTVASVAIAMEHGRMPMGATPQGPAASHAAPGQPGGMAQPGGMGKGGMMGHGMMGMGQGAMGQGGKGMRDSMSMPTDTPGRESGPMADAAPVDRIEGRIAFMRAELKVTEAQSAAWNEFAEALRSSAKRHNEMRGHKVAGGKDHKDLAHWFEQHEQMLAARLESTRAIRGALAKLQGAMTDEQRQTLDELMPMYARMI